MMSYQKEREEYIAIVSKEGMTLPMARATLRAATTLQRLAEDECNGVPWDRGIEPRHLVIKGNPAGQVTACGESLVTPENITAKLRTTFHVSAVSCPSCKSEHIEKRLLWDLNRAGFSANFQGDPRGAVIKIAVPSGKTNDWGNVGICVPTRG